MSPSRNVEGLEDKWRSDTAKPAHANNEAGAKAAAHRGEHLASVDIDNEPAGRGNELHIDGYQEHGTLTHRVRADALKPAKPPDQDHHESGRPSKVPNYHLPPAQHPAQINAQKHTQ